MSSARVASALERSRQPLPPNTQAADASFSPRRRVAIGDPQAPFEKVLEILDAHALLGSDGFLKADVLLVSMGDHFDWGRRSERAQAAADSICLLTWLLSQRQEQVVVLLGNHDLARVGELASFDDRSFAAAQLEADRIYGEGKSPVDEAEERAFIARYPALPSVEVAARDFATFNVRQRELIDWALDRRRAFLAYAAAPDLLLTHAGVSRDELDAIGVPAARQRDANVVAAALNRALVEAGRGADGSLSIPHLHRPGDAAFGEGRGMLYHRPSNLAHDEALLFERPWARRYDPRRLPLGLTQAVGHIRDKKCRTLLGAWASEEPATDGPIRHLRTNGAGVRYSLGMPAAEEPGTATMLFLDGGMNYIEAEQYELLDLDTRRPLKR